MIACLSDGATIAGHAEGSSGAGSDGGRNGAEASGRIPCSAVASEARHRLCLTRERDIGMAVWISATRRRGAPLPAALQGVQPAVLRQRFLVIV